LCSIKYQVAPESARIATAARQLIVQKNHRNVSWVGERRFRQAKQLFE